MKSAHDPRHKIRILIIKELFAESFSNHSKQSQLKRKVLARKKVLDALIKKSAPAWPLDKINKIDLAVLRLAVYELSRKKEPPKAVIDEAVEIAKQFGTESSPSFVNGVLGTVLKKYAKGK